MSFLWAVFKGIFSVTFVQKAITQGIPDTVWRYRRDYHGKVRQPEPGDSRHHVYGCNRRTVRCVSL